MLTYEQEGVVERIMALAKRSGMTAKDFAQRIGVGPTTVSEWKKGRTHPSVDHVRRIAILFDVSTDYIIFGHEYNERIAHDHKLDEISANTMYKAFDMLCTEHKAAVTDFITECIKLLAGENAPTEVNAPAVEQDDTEQTVDILKEFEEMKKNDSFGIFDPNDD